MHLIAAVSMARVAIYTISDYFMNGHAVKWRGPGRKWNQIAANKSVVCSIFNDNAQWYRMR